jgi:hypothetical protein
MIFKIVITRPTTAGVSVILANSGKAAKKVPRMYDAPRIKVKPIQRAGEIFQYACEAFRQANEYVNDFKNIKVITT